MENLAEKSPDASYDVVVVGGGPAGSTGSFILAKSGLNVLLVDKSKFPRKKVCGGLLTHKNMKLVDRIFDCSPKELREKDVIDEPRYKYRMDYNGKKIREFSLKNPIHFTNREEYDKFFLDMAEKAGVELLLGEKVIDLEVGTNTLETKSGKIIKGDFTLGADGVNSTVRKKIDQKFDQNRWDKYLGVAMQGRLNKGCLDNLDHHVLDFGFLDSGYGWIFPYKDHVNIGVGGLKKYSMRKSFSEFLSARKVEGAVRNVNGSSIPFGCYISDPTFENTYLVGDAAGFMNPLTGEGIYYAHKSAELAASSIIQYFKNGSPHPAKRYKRAIQKEVITEFNRFMMIRKLLWSTRGGVQHTLLNLFSPLVGENINKIIQRGKFLDIE